MAGHFLNRKAKCHPEEKHFAHGLCQPCYQIIYSKIHRKARELRCCSRCKRLRPAASKGIRTKDPLYKGKALCQTCYMIIRKETIKIDLLKKQNNKCAIAGCTTDTSKHTLKMWCLDHDHKCCSENNYHTTCVRGVLCKTCNILLGLVKDNVEQLYGAAAYLLRRQ